MIFLPAAATRSLDGIPDQVRASTVGHGHVPGRSSELLHAAVPLGHGQRHPRDGQRILAVTHPDYPQDLLPEWVALLHGNGTGVCGPYRWSQISLEMSTAFCSIRSSLSTKKLRSLLMCCVWPAESAIVVLTIPRSSWLLSEFLAHPLD